LESYSRFHQSCRFNIKPFTCLKYKYVKIHNLQTIEMKSKKPLILIVDDDDITRLMLRQILEDNGYEITEAENGEQGLQKFKNKHPDLVLLDVVMPELDGFETCQAIREISNFHLTPILMLTGLDDIESINKAFEAGATDFITKPINWPLLSQRVRYAVRAKTLSTALQESQQRLKNALQIAKLGYWELEIDNNQIDLSPEASKLFGIENKKKYGTFDDILTAIPLEDRGTVVRTIQQATKSNINYSVDHRIITQNGETFVNQTGEIFCDTQSQKRRIIGTIQDITERKKTESLIEFHAFYDSLTALPNRKLFLSRFQHSLALAYHLQSHIALCLIDIDRFKRLNDTYGHIFGDKIIQMVAERIRSSVNDADTLARLNGDEFSIVIEGYEDESTLEKIIENLHNSLKDPYIIENQTVHLNSCISYTQFPKDGRDFDILIRNADTAMAIAKKDGGAKIQCFNKTMHKNVNFRMELENALHMALEKDELEIFYQPQICLQDMRIIGVEALIRWHHPTHGLVSPTEFIPLAEENGLIVPIGTWVLNTAGKQIIDWQNEGFDNIRLAVNISARQFENDILIKSVDAMLTKTQLDPALLDLEVTESLAMNNLSQTISTLNDLKNIGVNTSIDDFGTGYSSLSYLQQLPISTLKIDYSFIRALGKKDDSSTIVKAIIAMAHSLNLNVIAEGAETQEQLNFLIQHKCNEVQGYFFSPPINSSQLLALLRKNGPNLIMFNFAANGN